MIAGGLPLVCVLADDLSGAAECAVLLREQGFATRLLLDTRAVDAGSAEAVVFDLDARDRALRIDHGECGPLEAAEVVFCKVDSLLRGSWARLVAAVRRPGRPKVVVCPALPRLGRQLVRGRLTLTPFESRRLGRDGTEPVDARRALRAAGLSVGQLPPGEACSAARLRDLLEDCDVALLDAGDDADLDAIANAAMACRERPILAGSAGLMEAAARHLRRPGGTRIDGAGASLELPLCFLIGSADPVSRRQLATLEARPGLYWLKDDLVHCSASGDKGSAIRVLHPVSTPLGLGGRELVSRFVQRSLPMASGARSLFASGGETGRVLCEQLGVRELQVEGSLEPGVSCVRLLGDDGPTLLLKSGSFGDDGLLVRVAEAGLSSARTEFP